MEKEKVYMVSVVQIQIISPFLKIFARNLNGKDTKEFRRLKSLFNSASESFNELSVEDICIVKMNSLRYERCKILNILDEQQANIELVDCALTGNVPTSQLRLLSDVKIKEFPSQCLEFIIAKVMLSKQPDPLKAVNKLHELLLPESLEMAVIATDSSGAYVDLRIKDASLVDDIIPNNVDLKNSMVPISLEQQKKEMRKKVNETPTQLTLLDEHVQSLAYTISPSSMIQITAYDKGVNSFYVRFKSKSDQCRNFILKIQAMRDNLVPLRLVPNKAAINKLCITLYDKRLYRSRIVQVDGYLPRHSVTVQLLETGERLTTNIKHLFKMPDEILNVPPFAKHMKLVNFEIVPPLDKLLVNFYFNYITNHKILALKVVEDNGETSAIQPCELFENGESVVDKICSWKFNDLEYLPQPILKNDVKYRASIVSGSSPENFFVHIIDESLDSKYKELEKINEIATPNLKDPSEGSVCLVKYNDGIQRAKIIWKRNPFYSVQFVDVGNQDDISESEMKILLEEHTKIPPLAYQCKLKEYDGEEMVCAQTIKVFGKIIDSCEEFELTVHEHNEKYYLVDLKDPDEKKSVYEMITEKVLTKISKFDWTENVTPVTLYFEQKKMMHKPNDTVHHNTLIAQVDISKNWGCEQEKTISSNCDDWDSVLRQKTPPLVTRRSLDTEVRSENLEKSSDTVASSSGFSSLQSNRADNSQLVRITAVASAEDFTVQSIDKAKRYSEYQKQLQTAANSMPQQENIDVGKYCLAFHPFDKMWCRAVMIDAETEDFLVTMQCVDDGTTFCLTDKSELKSTSIDLLAEPFFGIKCSLVIKINEKRENVATQQLMRLMNDRIKIRFVVKHSNLHFVELMVQGKNLADSFIESGLGKKIFVVSADPVTVNKIDSLENFSVQLTESCEKIKYIDEQMKNYKCCEVSAPKIGMLVLARFSIEKTWHRARILSKEEGGFNVYLIDCGYSTFVNEIGASDDTVLTGIPETAVKCSLLLPSNVQSQAKEAEQKFREFVESGKHKFNVEMVEPTPKCAIVKLFMDDEDILEKLFPVTSSTFHGKFDEKVFKTLFD